MPEIDASIIGKLNIPQNDPLAVAGKAQNLASGMLQNRLVSQQIGGKEALAKAITGATNPDTGVTDFDKAAGSLALDPKGSFALPEFAKDVLERKSKEIANATAQAGLTKAQLEISQAKYKAIGDLATSVAALGAKDPAALTSQQIIGTFKTGLIDTGMVNPQNPQERDQLLSVMAQFGNDPKENMEILKRIILQSRATTEGVGMVLGTPTQVDRGPEILTQQTSPLTGETTVGAVTQKGRTPAETMALVDVYDPVTKSMVKKPAGQIAGDLPAGVTPQAALAGAPLGAAEAENAAAQGSVKQAQDLRVKADEVPAQQAALKNIRDTVDSFKPGAKTNWIYAAKALATQLGVAPAQMRDEVAAQEEFNKLATQFINQQMGALGGSGTDSKLESAAKGTPNEFMSKEGIQNVTSLMMGLNEAVLAKNAAWQKWLDAGNSPGSYGKFQTQFNAIYNPRVFQSQFMTDKQKQTMLGNMTPAERKAFQKDWTTAKAAGWIK